MSAVANKRKGLVLALAILGLLAVPSVAAATPACGVYCEDPAPDPGQRDKPGATDDDRSGSNDGAATEPSNGSGGDAATAGGNGSADDGSANPAAQRAAHQLRNEGGGDRLLAKALEETAPRDKDRGSGDGDDTASGGGTGDAALAGVSEGGGGLGWLFPALLVATALWAVIAAVRRRRGSAV